MSGGTGGGSSTCGKTSDIGGPFSGKSKRLCHIHGKTYGANVIIFVK